MGPSGKYILEFHRTFRWLPSSAERRLADETAVFRPPYEIEFRHVAVSLPVR